MRVVLLIMILCSISKPAIEPRTDQYVCGISYHHITNWNRAAAVSRM